MNKSFKVRVSFLIMRLIFPVISLCAKFFTIQRQQMEFFLRKDSQVLRPSDILLCTYPKSGSTWLQMILFQLTTPGDMNKVLHLSQEIPHFEEAPFPLSKLPEPRIFKTHLLPADLHPEAKCIYMARNGLDVANSFYHHYLSNMSFPGSADQFFNLFLAGRVAYGSWFDHLKAWGERMQDPKVLFLSYEDARADLEGTIRQIAAFLSIPIDEANMPRILEGCSFDYMKSQSHKLEPATLRMNLALARGSSIVREGEVGKGKDSMNPSQVEQFGKIFGEKLCNSGWDRYRP